MTEPIKKKYKLMHVVNSLSRDGTSTIVLDICSGIDTSIFDVTILSLGTNTELLASYSLPKEIKIITCNYEFDENFSLRRYFAYAFKPNLSAIRGKEIIEKIIEFTPDLIHFHTNPRELMLGVIAGKKIKAELIFTDHLCRLSSNEYSFFIRQCLAMVYRRFYRSYHLLAVSESVKRSIERNKLLGRGKKLRLMKNGINIKMYPPSKKIIRDNVTVIYAARISPVKGHIDLLKAWLKINSDKKKKLLLVGKDFSGGEVQKFVDEHIKDDSVHLLGLRNDIPKLLNDADIGVFPSHKEGLPLALLEKMAMELPVLVSDIEELKDIVTDNINGLIFKCGDIDELSKKLGLLLRDEELRARLGKKARETVLKEYDNSQVSKKHQDLYLNILEPVQNFQIN